MKKVLVIHGGNTYRSYDAFVEYLKQKEVDPERLKPSSDWKYFLREKLGSEYDVYNPSMPNTSFSEYYLWELWYKKIVEAIGVPDIIIGHSLGAMFLVKYYSEHISKKQVDAIFLVAPVYCGAEKENHHCHSFSFDEDIGILKKNAKNIHFFFSEDDFVVSFDNYDFYKKTLPDATYSVFKEKGHFLQESFPEMVEKIKGLARTL